MSGALGTLLDVLHPRTARRLREANTVTLRTPLAVASAFPWLLGRGPSLGIVSQMNAVSVGDKPAIHDRHGSISWRELDARVNQVAHVLEAQGVGPRSRVAMLLRNGREIVEVALACQKLGVIACPLNTWAKPKELRAVMDSLEPDLLIYDVRHGEQAADAAPKTLRRMHVGDDDEALPDSESYVALTAGASSAPVSPFTRDRGAPKIIIQTSGTTGTPKGASRDASTTGLGAIAGLLEMVPYRREDVVLCPAPMFHSFGLGTFVWASSLGTTLVLPERFDPEECLALIEKHRVTAASFVPVMIRRIVSLPNEVKGRYDLSSLRIVLASGSALSLDLKGAARDLFGDVLYDLYGSTEIGWVAIATPDVIRDRPRSVGKPVRGTEVAVFSADGERLPAGETGELFIKSEILFEGYTSGESKAERNGFVSIGDVGHLDESGYLYVESRSDDMVVIGGENVYPIEVEETIEAIDGVTEVTVVGVPDEEYGEVLAAFVVGSAGPDEIRARCEDELASYKVPRRIEIVDELPRTSTGKVLKRDLIARSG